MHLSNDSYNEFENIFLRSLAFFWRKDYINLLVVLDEESPYLEYFKAKITNLSIPQTNYTRVVLNKLLFQMKGHDRQQWIQFWADNFTSSEYVGFVDTDTLFVSRVLHEDLFVGDKPRVQPIFGGPPLNSFWARVPSSTHRALGFKEKFKGMSYFPVVIKLSHLPFIREHIRKHLKKTTFDEAFKVILKSSYSQFNLMVNVLYEFYHDEYKWNIDEQTFNWTGPPVNGQIKSIAEGGIRPYEIRSPYPRIAIHFNYEHLSFSSIEAIMVKGYCYGIDSNTLAKKKFCQIFNVENKLNELEWRFESKLYSERSFVLDVHKARRQLINKLNNALFQ